MKFQTPNPSLWSACPSQALHSYLTTLPSFTFTVSPQLLSWLSVSLHGHCSCQGCQWASSMLPNPVTASVRIFFEFLAISNILSFQMSLSVSLIPRVLFFLLLQCCYFLVSPAVSSSPQSADTGWLQELLPFTTYILFLGDVIWSPPHLWNIISVHKTPKPIPSTLTSN